MIGMAFHQVLLAVCLHGMTAQVLEPSYDPGTNESQPVLFLGTSDAVQWSTDDGQSGAGQTFLFQPPGPGVFRVVATLGDESEDRFVYVQGLESISGRPDIRGFRRSLATVNPGQAVTITPEFTDFDSFGPWAVHWSYISGGELQRATAPSLTVSFPSEAPDGIDVFAVVADTDGNYALHEDTKVFVLNGNLPPTSRIVQPKYRSNARLVGEPVTFLADAIDVEGDSVSYTWRNLETLEEYAGNLVEITFEEETTAQFQLIAQDARGNIDPSLPQVTVYAYNSIPDPYYSFKAPIVNQRVFVDDSIILAGFATHSNSDVDVVFDVLRDGSLVQQFPGTGPHRVFFDRPGFYELQLNAPEFAVSRDASNTRFVAVQAPTDNGAPFFVASPDGFQYTVPNGSTQTITLAAQDPEGDALTFTWYREGQVLAGSGPSQTLTFALPADAFSQGLAYTNLSAFVRDSAGNFSERAGGAFVVIYQDRKPPSAEINDLDNLSTIRVQRGKSVDFFADVEDDDGLDLSFFWTINRGLTTVFTSDQRNPGPVLFDEPGVYFASLSITTSDFGLRAAVIPSIWIQVYDPALKPETLITRPLESELVLEVGSELRLEGAVNEPQYVDASYFISTYEQVDNALKWAIDGPDGLEFIQSDEQVTYRFETEGDYSIRLETLNALGFTDPDPDSFSVTVVGARGDASLEPNDSRDQAALLTPGRYGQLTLDESDPVDWYAFVLNRQGASFELTFDLTGSETDGALDVYFADGLVQSSRLRAGSMNPFVFNGSRVGTYHLKVSLNQSAAKQPGGLNFGVGVTTANPRLVFPYPKYDVVDVTDLTVVNPFNDPAVVIFEARSNDGLTLAEVSVNLGPNARTERSVEDLFPQLNVLELDWVRVRSDRGVVGMGLTLGRDQKTAVAEPAIIGNLDELVVPHIAQNTQQWFTKAAIINNSSVISTTMFNAVAGDWMVAGIANPYAHDLFDFVNFFGGNLPSGTEWGRFVESNANPAIAGMEIFGKRDGNLQVAGLNLSSDKLKNPNFFYLRKDIVFPHVAADTANFWTGIAFVNTTDAPAGAVLRAYNAAGAVLAEDAITIEPRGKRVGLAYQLFSGLDANTAISWVHLETSDAITGYELFGSNDGTDRRLAGLQAVAGGGTSLVIPKVWVEPGLYWTGIAAVNLSESDSATLTYTAYGDDGSVRATAQRAIGPLQKDVALAEQIFGGLIPSGTTWMRIESTQPIAAFELVGDINGNFLAGVNAQ